MLAAMLGILLLGATLIGGAGLSPALEAILESNAADGLLAPLRRYETAHPGRGEAAQAALLLGHLHLARAEYRLAADAFSRSAAYDPAGRDEARYWAGVAWLGVPEPRRARALF